MSIEEYRNILDNGPTYEKPKQRHNDSEHQLQCACIQWFRYIYPSHVILAIPNAARRSARMGAYMKQEGMLTGCPDLLIPEARKGYNCLWIEMKNGKKGHLSEAQKEVHKQLLTLGNQVKVARNKDEFINTVTEYFN